MARNEYAAISNCCCGFDFGIVTNHRITTLPQICKRGSSLKKKKRFRERATAAAVVLFLIFRGILLHVYM